MLRVSVAMCTYNGERFLPEQLESIANQTQLPHELVICDDQSTDQTETILRAFASRAPFPVRWVRNECRLGVTANFEKAIRLCEGDVIALSDQDDFWMPEKLARLTFLLEQQAEAVCVFSDAVLMDQGSQALGQRSWARFLFTSALQQRMRGGDAVGVLLKVPVVSGAAMLFRTELRERLLPIPECWVHDAWIAWAAALSGPVLPVVEPLIRYRLHEAQQLGLPLETGRQRRKRLGIRRWRAQEKADAVRQYEHMARTYGKLAEHVRQRGFGTTKEQKAIQAKAQFAEQVLRMLEMPPVLRVLAGLPRVGAYQRFTPRGLLTLWRHSVL